MKNLNANAPRRVADNRSRMHVYAMYDIRCTAYTYVYYVYAPACLLLPRRPTATYPILSKFRLTIPKTFTFPPPRALKVIQQLYTFFDPAGAIYYRNTRSGAAARLRKGRAARPRLSIMKVISPPPCLRSLFRSTSLPFVRPKDDSFTTEKLYGAPTACRVYHHDVFSA